jgi:hypothetical protein
MKCKFKVKNKGDLNYKIIHIIQIQNCIISWVLMSHTCNPSYSGGREQQEDYSSKPTQANSLQDPILKKPITKKWLKRVAPEFKLQY